MVSLRFIDDQPRYNCSSKEKSPVDFLLMSVAMCLASEMLQIKKQDCFEDVNVYLGNEELKISCLCREVYKQDFRDIVSNCYIVKNLKFGVKISFITMPDA